MTHIRTESPGACLLCSGEGREQHAGLRDHLFGAPGVWRTVRCAGCGLVWLDPRPAPADIGRVYETYYTHVAAARSGEVFAQHFTGGVARLRAAMVRRWGLARRAIASRRLGYGDAPAASSIVARALAAVPALRDSVTLGYADLPASRRGRLLDVGCGNGEFLLRMRDLGWTVSGVEPDPAAAKYARTHHGLAVRDGVLEEAGFADASFDAVVLSHVIEHVYDPVSLLRECGRVLAPGGVIVVITPNARGLGHRLLGRHWRGLEPPRHLHVFDAATLPACARRAGLAVTSLRTSARLMSSIWYASRGIRRADGFGVPSPSRADYILSYIMAAVEDACRLARPYVGEEIIMTAIAADHSPGAAGA